MEIVPFNDRHVRSAATLLASGHSGSVLDLAEPEAAVESVREWRGSGPAVAAVDEGAVIGFMAATLADSPGSQRARIRIDQHVAREADRRDIYRSLYAALSGELAAVGAFEHTIAVSADHGDVLRHLFELGFGVDQIRGRRNLVSPRATYVTVRPATTEDIEQCQALTVELQHFHAAPPMLRPALVDLRQINDAFRDALADGRKLLLVAESGGRVVGLMQAYPDRHYRGTATIGLAVVTAAVRAKGVGTALLAGVVDWAAAQGFEACAVEWTSANPVSDPFWRGHGFDPVRYSLARLIDARVAWADTGLSYQYFAR